MNYKKINQYIKIKAIGDDNNHLGTFKVSIDYPVPIDYLSEDDFDDYTYDEASEEGYVDDEYTSGIRVGGDVSEDSNDDVLTDYRVFKDYLHKENFNKEVPIDNLILYNVPIVKGFNNKKPIKRSPIQYYENDNFNANILLLEEKRYYIEFDSNCDDSLEVYHNLKHTKNSPIQLPPNTNSGFLQFRSYVGKTFLDLYDSNEGKNLYKCPIEIRSRKINYRKDYATMIADLSRFSSGLVYELSSPVFQSLKRDSNDKTAYEDFMLLEYLFEDENLPATVEYLSKNLYTLLEETKEEVPTSFAFNVGPNELIDVFSNGKNLEKVDDNLIWSKTKGYAPLFVKETKYVDYIDVPENRFYKNFLLFIDALINNLITKIDVGYALDKLYEYKETLSYFLSARYFLDISPMHYPPLNSQVLQKKEGYRDILEYYILFEFAYKFNWGEVIDDFKGYEKKVYRLYEFWCYFELLNVVEEITNTKISFENLFNIDDKKLNISLEEGSIKSFKISYNDLIRKAILYLDNSFGFTELDEDLPISIDLMYNKEFDKGADKNYYSYSVKLRPDYTLSIKFNEKTYLIHFDAKYKIDINSEEYKNQDIVKMHSYKDAIKDTLAAYVLYPGKQSQIFPEKENSLKSVGAFPLNPNKEYRENDEKALLKFILKFILDLVI